jgi:hypothetical protein
VLTDPRQVPSPGMVVGDAGRGVDRSALAARFREKRAEIRSEGSPATARWAAFSSGAWDPHATAHALDEAALALTGMEDDAPRPTSRRRRRGACCAACPKQRRGGGRR